MANEFVKKIKINVDSKEVDALENQLRELAVFDIGQNTKAIRESAKELQALFTLDEKIEQTEKAIAGWKRLGSTQAQINVKALQEQLQALKQKKALLGDLEEDEEATKEFAERDRRKKTFTDYFADKALDVIDTGLDKLKVVFTDAWEELGNMVESSFLTSSKTRQNLFTYGMSAGQSYGFEFAKRAMGLSDEDLMYMNGEQAQLFQSTMTKYAEKYNKLYDQGYYTKMMEFQVEMAEFKQDLTLEVVDFFMNNKETIKAGMNAIMTLAKTVMQILSIMTGSSSQSSSDIVNSYSNSTKNITIDNTFNVSGSTNQEFLTNVGNMTFSQAKAALINS